MQNDGNSEKRMKNSREFRQKEDESSSGKIQGDATPDDLFQTDPDPSNNLFATTGETDPLFSENNRTDYRRMFEKVPAAMLVLDKSGKILKANYAAARLLGHTPVRLEQTFFADYLKKADRDSFLIVTKKPKSSRNHSIWEGQTAKTERIFRMRSFSDDKNQNLLLSLEDITDEKKKLGREEARAQQLQEDSQLYRMAVERSEIGLWKASLSKKQAMEEMHFHFSDKGGDIFGFVSFADIGFTQFMDTIHSDSVEKIRGALRSAINSKIGFDIEIRINKPNGDFAWVNWKCFLIEENQTGAILLEGIALDITSHKTTEKALAIASSLFENNRDGIFIADQTGRITVVNYQFTRMTGLSQEQIMGNHQWYLQPGISDSSCYSQLCDVIICTDHEEMATFEKNREQRIEPTYLTIKIVRDMDEKIISYIGVLLDISQNDFLEDHTRYMIEHDFLTGLPNRILLLDRLGQTLIAAERNHRRAAVMFLDLDKFKHINDTLGHAIGDRLLQQVAQRLTQCVRKNDTVSRQGGDEFVILLSDIGEADDAAMVANNIMHTLSQNYQIENYEMSITSSIGIALFPEDGKEIDTLLKNADTAMYHAKENGRNAYQFFNAEMNLHLIERSQLEEDLKTALKNGDFFLEYQPIIDMHNQHMTGVEAFLRWNHPQFGILMPSRFLSIAENTGLIGPIGEWVINTACKQAKKWKDQGFSKTVSVNLSSIQLKQKDLLGTIKNALEENDLTPDFLELQITEGSITENIRTVIDLLNELRNMGVKIALDNFGNGCSSISHLKRVPIEKIKIDPSFIRALGTQSSDADVAGAIIAMAKNLNLKVSAGGVETTDQANRLKEIGCDEYQGYVISPTLPAKEINRLQLPN